MTGGFAILAYPAEYGASGVMTFSVSQGGYPVRERPGRFHGGHGEGDQAV
jgi:hypothetical protein